MKTRNPSALLASASLVAALTFGQFAFADHHMSSTAGKSMAGHSAGSKELHHSMMSGHDMQMPMSGNVDKDFAMMMTMHHQQAVKMIDVLLKHGKSEKLKVLARKMRATQLDEIKKMAPFAGPMDHSKMDMGKGGMKHDSMEMDHSKMDHSKMDMDKGTMKHDATGMDHGKMAEAEFNKLDANKDGKLGKTEISSEHPMHQHFGMLDSDKDGSLSRVEFAKHHGM